MAPSGKSVKTRQSLPTKIFLLFISENQNYKPRHLIPEEGRWPSSPRLGWDAVDADSVRYVSHLDEALSAYGEVVWSWRRDAGVKFVSKSSRATVATSPFTGESAL